MKSIIKQWWIWLIIIILVIISMLIYLDYEKATRETRNYLKETKESTEKIKQEKILIDEKRKSIDNKLQDNLDKIDYNPNNIITIDKYNKIKKGMSEQEVNSILGPGDKIINVNAENTYLTTWGDLDLSKYPYYRIQITFNLKDNTVINAYQVGL